MAKSPGETDNVAERSPYTAIVVFDGECRVCDGWARSLQRIDRRGGIAFMPAQHPHGAKLLRQAGVDPASLDSVLLLEGGRAHLRSAAILRAFVHLGGAWNFARAFLLVPRSLRDLVYDAFAARRRRLFGTTASCLAPDPRLAR